LSSAVAHLVLVRRMRALFSIICIALVASSECVHAGSKPTDITDKPESAYRRYVGKRVTVRGRFSLPGKFGAFVHTPRSDIYIIPMLRPPAQLFTWDRKIYGSLENRRVTATGILRFSPGVASTGDSDVAEPPDYYYFELDQTSISRSPQ
jgi:hypothetical protein